MDKLVRRLLVALGLLLMVFGVLYHISVFRQVARPDYYAAMERARLVAVTIATAGLGLIVTSWWMPPLSPQTAARWSRRLGFNTGDKGGA